MATSIDDNAARLSPDLTFSAANVSGIPLDNFCEMRGHYNHMEATERIAAEVKQSAYEIISRKTYRVFWNCHVGSAHLQSNHKR